MTPRKLSRGVAVVGAGMSGFGAFPGLSTRDLFVDAFLDMRRSIDQGLDPATIEALYLGNFSSSAFEGQGFIAPLTADAVGLLPKPSTRVENACASGGTAVREAMIAVASGLYDVVLAGGIEKQTDLPIARVTDVLATASDTQYEGPAGFTFPGLFGALATAYMDRYGATPEAFMRVAIKNHDNGAVNPRAQFGKRIDDIMAAKRAAAERKGRTIPDWADELEFLADDRANPVIAWPMRLFDCSPVSDGAACVLVVAAELAAQFTDSPLHIVGYGQASAGAAHDRADLTSLSATRDAASQAYAVSGLGPADIDLAEVHDCFTIAEIMATEDLGFFDAGRGWAAATDGATGRDGAIPINTSGGLKSKGHPVGATGVAQVVEVWKQLRGEAGDRQVPGNPSLGLTHNLGGSGQACVVHIFQRRS